MPTRFDSFSSDPLSLGAPALARYGLARAAGAQKLLISQSVARDVTDWVDSRQAAFGPDSQGKY
jgi:hypothetical protein